jgi:2',3'-cyclic-nucleotide 2'-phosphodiesterase/3'-nucleotidase
MSFTMALNNYRQSGGGGFDMLKGSPVVYNKFQSIRDLIIEYISKKGTISPNEVFVKNWEVINN